MKLFLVTIRDAVAGTWRAPACVNSLGGFLRGMSDEVNRAAPDNDFYKHPEDFEVYKLGMYDDESGRFELEPNPVSIGLLKSMVRAPQ